MLITCPQALKGFNLRKQLTGIGVIFIKPGCIGHTLGYRLGSSYHGLTLDIVKLNYSVFMPNISIGLSPFEKSALNKLTDKGEINSLSSVGQSKP